MAGSSLAQVFLVSVFSSCIGTKQKCRVELTLVEIHITISVWRINHDGAKVLIERRTLCVVKDIDTSTAKLRAQNPGKKDSVSITCDEYTVLRTIWWNRCKRLNITGTRWEIGGAGERGV